MQSTTATIVEEPGAVESIAEPDPETEKFLGVGEQELHHNKSAELALHMQRELHMHGLNVWVHGFNMQDACMRNGCICIHVHVIPVCMLPMCLSAFQRGLLCSRQR